MNAWKTYPLTVLLAATIFGCSARPVDLTDGPPQAPGRVARLEKAFRNREISRTDKMRVAAELVRLGVRKPVYRAYIEDQVNQALDAEERAAEEWDFRHDHRPDAALRRMPVAMNISTRNAGDMNVGTVGTVAAGTPDRPPNATNLLPLVMRSMTATEGDVVARDQLRRALKGGNVLLSAEAALGLAKLKDKESINDIADAPFVSIRCSSSDARCCITAIRRRTRSPRVSFATRHSSVRFRTRRSFASTIRTSASEVPSPIVFRRGH
jgi:hypothetical protein